MTPPEAPVVGDIAGAAEKPPAVSVCLDVLRKRTDFVAASKALRQVMPGFLLQARVRKSQETPDTIRVGFTCSKKVGNAVARNRAKRRLREIARAVLPITGRPGWDYVLVGRANVTASRPYADLLVDMHKAMAVVHGGRK